MILRKKVYQKLPIKQKKLCVKLDVFWCSGKLKFRLKNNKILSTKFKIKKMKKKNQQQIFGSTNFQGSKTNIN